MGKFEKGNKVGKGRPKGVPNKTTAEIRDTINQIVSKGLDFYLEDIEKIRKNNPEKAFELTQKLIDYIVPKQSKLDIKGDIEHTVNKLVIEIKTKDGIQNSNDTNNNNLSEHNK